MKVGKTFFVCPTLGGGGSERDAVVLATAYLERGWPSGILVLRAEGPNLERIPHGVELVDLACPRVAYSALKLFKFISDRPRDTFVFLDFDMAVVAGALRRLVGLKARLVYRESNMPMYYVPKRRRWLFPSFIGRMDALICQNVSEKRELSLLGVRIHDVHVVPNPTIFPSYVEAFKGPHSGGPVSILGVGRLDFQKAHHRLIKLFSSLVVKRPGSTLTILGEGPLRGELENLIVELGLTESVFLPGFVKNADEWRKKTDLFVMTSYFEGQPNALLESIAAGTRYLSTPCGGGVSELLSEIGADECILSEDLDGVGFMDVVDRVLGYDSIYWSLAYGRLTKFIDFEKAVAGYRNACK